MRFSSALAASGFSMMMSGSAGAYCCASDPDSWSCRNERRMEQLDRDTDRTIKDLQRQEDREK